MCVGGGVRGRRVGEGHMEIPVSELIFFYFKLSQCKQL